MKFPDRQEKTNTKSEWDKRTYVTHDQQNWGYSHVFMSNRSLYITFRIVDNGLYLRASLKSFHLTLNKFSTQLN